MFEPIAIIGRSCLLPGADTPAAFWQNVLKKQNCLRPAQFSDWRTDPLRLLAARNQKNSLDQVDSINFGFVEDIQMDLMAKQDQITQWLFYTCRNALQEAKISHISNKQRTGAIMGNLIYPTFAFNQLAETIWLNQTIQSPVEPMHRFMSGYPLQFVAQSLNFNGPCYTLDAACASALYAIKLACDQLQSGQADLMLAGGINAADSLFLNMGFSALKALSTSGNSSPLQQQADGLVPAHGAAVVALRRLSDAIANNDRIYGVIEGVGLSNDGRTGGLLQPDQAGQIRAIELAYRASSIDPNDISWLECHATGTAVGDATEITSLTKLFTNTQDCHISALKAAIGHTITASGAAALINTLSAFEHEIKPPSLVPINHAISLLKDDAKLALLEEPCAWPANSKKPRFAGINCFGFGGNNAHLLVRDYHPRFKVQKINQVSKKSIDPIAIVAMSSISGSALTTIELDAKSTRFPPADLKHALGQQLLMMQMAEVVLEQLNTINPERTSALIGMQCDAEIARWGLRWRLEYYFPQQSTNWLADARAAIVAPLQAADVIGTLPNVVANRLNIQYDFKGPSYSVCGEELSGISALAIACRALQRHEIDTALVGAIDLNCELIHTTVMNELFKDKVIPADAAIMLVLKR